MLTLSVRALATFTAAMLAARVLGNLLFGWVADRAGHRRVIVMGLASMVAANACALAAHFAVRDGPSKWTPRRAA